MIALPRLLGWLQEQHALHRHDVWADQALQHVEDARMQQVLLVQRQVPVELDEPEVIVLL
jgi:hypothetical protein